MTSPITLLKGGVQMFVYQNGKLYVTEGDKLVGVNVSSEKVELVKGTETVMGDKFSILTGEEVRAKFNILSGGNYKFPKVNKRTTKK